MNDQLDDYELSVSKELASFYAESFGFFLDEKTKELITKAYLKGYEQGMLDERQENYYESMGEDL